MTGFIAHLYNLLLHVTDHYLTRYVFCSPSSSTATSRDSLSSVSTGLESSLHSLGAAPTENTVIEQFLYCCRGVFTSPLHRNGSSSVVTCAFISAGNLFTESLPSNESLLWLRYSGFQASCHNIKCQAFIETRMRIPFYQNVKPCSLVDTFL
jgi:hypothetical protein